MFIERELESYFFNLDVWLIFFTSPTKAKMFKECSSILGFYTKSIP